MKTIYNESLGNSGLIYSAFCEKDKETNQDVYSILVRNSTTSCETLLRSFTSKKEKAIDFIEALIRNAVSPEYVTDIAEDYLLA